MINDNLKKRIADLEAMNDRPEMTVRGVARWFLQFIDRRGTGYPTVKSGSIKQDFTQEETENFDKPETLGKVGRSLPGGKR